METRKQESRYIHSLFSRFFFAAPFRWVSKWLAARCLLASRFLVFSFFGVVLARSFFSPLCNYGFQKLCKGVHLVDLGESFQTHICLQNLASIQPRTSLVKFARPSNTAAIPTSPLIYTALLTRRRRCIDKNVLTLWKPDWCLYPEHVGLPLN